MRRTHFTVGCMLGALLSASTAGAIPLQSAYDVALPGEGFDRLLILDPEQAYTGGMSAQDGVRSLIRGNGAVINLEGESIWGVGHGTVLDIDHCVILNGYSGVFIAEEATGHIRNNTIRGNAYGITSWYGSPDVVIENNIILENKTYGIYCREFFEPIIQYNAVWGNPGGNYIHSCG